MSGMAKCDVMLDTRICDEPATRVYHGIGGHQPRCPEHAAVLYRLWGIKCKPIAGASRSPGGPQ